MVAKASWLTIEPEISLEAFLASEETEFFPSPTNWNPEDWTIPAEWNETCPPADPP